jgi:hypothetical protein
MVIAFRFETKVSMSRSKMENIKEGALQSFCTSRSEVSTHDDIPDCNVDDH